VTTSLSASEQHQDAFGEALFYTGMCQLLGAHSYEAVRRLDDLLVEVRGPKHLYTGGIYVAREGLATKQRVDSRQCMPGSLYVKDSPRPARSPYMLVPAEYIVGWETKLRAGRNANVAGSPNSCGCFTFPLSSCLAAAQGLRKFGEKIDLQRPLVDVALREHALLRSRAEEREEWGVVEALLQQALLLVKQVGVAMQLRGLLALQLGVVQYKHRQAGHGKLLLAPCHRLETALPAWMLHAWVQGGWKRP